VFRVYPRFLPDGFRHCGLGAGLLCDEDAVLTEQGDCFVAVVEPFDAAEDRPLCHAHHGGEVMQLEPGQEVALILAYRRSLMELSSTLEPYRLARGDRVTLLGGDGYAGSFYSRLESYGTPVSARILGGIVDPRTGRLLRTGDHPRHVLPGPSRSPQAPRAQAPLVIGVAGVRMDSGKSIVGRNLAGLFQAHGLAVAAGKVTGFGCLHETRALTGGVTADFTDFGLPSTCGPDLSRVLEAASSVIDFLEAGWPDVILLEFGGDLIGPYRVTETLAALRDRIGYLVFVAFDLCGVAGAIEELRRIRMRPDTVSGPIANNRLGVSLIAEHFGIHAESSLEPMSCTVTRALERRGADTHAAL
jgi:hypothetical protein